MPKPDMTVVRNQAYQKGGIGIRERHNERKNESYRNPDIEPGRSPMNVHFMECEGTYAQTLDQMIADKTVSMRGLKENAKVFEEMVFDVNTAYFENHGGYEYAKEFFREAFRFAEKEVGSRYILSAVMHSDEKNRALSAEYGRSLYHYHMHIIYLPVVDKEVRWTKKCKDKELVGTVKEVIHQISHSKKWAFPPMLDGQGKPVLSKSGKPKRIPSYSLLQDRFFEHMRGAGFEGFERGVRSSTENHLSVLDYKIKQDKGRLEALESKISGQESELGEINKELAAIKTIKAEVDEISAIGRKKPLSGKVEMSANELLKLQSLAKEGLTAQGMIDSLHRQLSDMRKRIWSLTDELNALYDRTRDFLAAAKLAPERVRELFTDIFKRKKAAAGRDEILWDKMTRGRGSR